MQLKQMGYLKRNIKRSEINHYAIVTYSRPTRLKHTLDIYHAVVAKTSILEFTTKRDALKALYTEYLRSWKCAITPGLLVGAFFSTYARAYTAFNKLCGLGLLTKRGAFYFVAA
jgi:hypothetical protein